MIGAGLVFYAFSTFGLAYIVGHSTITKGIRERMFGKDPDPTRFLIRRLFVELLECPACFGFWTGVAMAILGTVPFDVDFNPIAWGLFTSGSNYVMAKITKLIN